MNPFEQLIDILVGLYIIIILLRFFLQYFRADFHNPLSQFSVKATDPLIKPLRKIIPGLGGIDMSSLFLAYLFSLVLVFLNPYHSQINIVLFFVFGFFELIQNILYFFGFMIIAKIILSWFSQGSYNPVIDVIQQLSEPVLRPFRRLLPPMVGFDLSPILAIIFITFFSQSIDYWFIPLIKQI